MTYSRSLPRRRLDAVEMLYLARNVDALGKKGVVGNLVADIVELHGSLPFAAALLSKFTYT